MKPAEPRLASMTGFSRAQGEVLGENGQIAWIWELRSVNGRGLELKLRLPPGLEALEPALREASARVLKRGNVSGSLTLRRDTGGGFVLDVEALARVQAVAIDLADRIPGALPPRAELLLALPGVMRSGAQEDDESLRTLLREAVTAGFAEALDALAAARAEEGARLRMAVASLLDEIEALRSLAQAEAANQAVLHRARLFDQLATLLEGTRGLPEERIAQEVALLATKSDVREELDRLHAHVEAARGLLRDAVAVGRRLDFLVQEFNREANTLCSKSVSLPLTATGLKLKAAIEQLREQVANIE